ncbi:PhnE/PtxC family ABC transporter permease [Frigidibacter sp. MR17.24]|uniref:PhnE/PtxC family ABC transporter permease n=1 Tax=Frigidibacter sp. MR17.24 TaxID=3127345 RepID=UPI003012E2B6
MIPRLTGRGMLAIFAVLSLAALWRADLSGQQPDPWLILSRIGQGLLHPALSDPGAILRGTALTLAFAFVGVALGAGLGLLAAPFYRRAPVRLACIGLRALHELFWALLLINLTGLSPLTGVLAIGLPYAGICAKVFADYLDEADPGPARALPGALPPVLRLLWLRLPQCLPEMRVYTLYRLECAMRSSAVLGFIGLPTLGFHLETFFKQAHYAEAAAVLMIFLGLILPLRHWMRWRLVPVFLALSLLALAQVEVPPMGPGALGRFLSDIVPAPIRGGTGWEGWLSKVFLDQAWPGVVVTLVLSQVALAGTTVFAAAAFPLIVPRVVGRAGAALGHAVLVVFRSLPEYVLAFLFLQVFGASMLPAILALALHNGAIIAHLAGRQAQGLALRADAPRGLTLWAWELFPRLQANFWALCLYRWEIILRESAIMGLLGVGTLGYFVQRNLQELRLDRVVALLVVTVLVTLGIDALSRGLRARLRAGLRAGAPDGASAGIPAGAGRAEQAGCGPG